MLIGKFSFMNFYILCRIQMHYHQTCATGFDCTMRGRMITDKLFVNRYNLTVVAAIIVIALISGYPAWIQLQKESRQDQALETLRSIQTAQRQYRDDPARGAGSFASDLKALGYACEPDASFVGPEPARYRFKCDIKACRAEAQNPESVYKPLLILEYE